MSRRYDFASDNASAVAPEAMEALVRANVGNVDSYGADETTARAADKIRHYLDADADVRFTVSGTAANSIALSMLAQRFESVLAHEHSHVVGEETGAPAFFGGGLGMTRLPGESGRILPAALESALRAPQYSRRQSPGALSLTQATEYGVLYSEELLAKLISSAKAAGLGIHMDGAHLAVASAAGFDARALKRLGVDILVLGGTKAGMPPTEALVLLDKSRSRRIDPRMKQMGQLPSKVRYLSAPWLGMLSSGAWLAYARHANEMAHRLAASMPFPVSHPVETNAVFVQMDEPHFQALRKRWLVHRMMDDSVRFVCSWSTSIEAVDEIGKDLVEIVRYGHIQVERR
jgi:threonine aldolase